MAKQQLRAWGLIGMAATLLWMVLTVADLSSAEARMGRMGGFGGSRGGFGGGFQGGFGHTFHGGVGQGFHGGFTHSLAFHNPVVVNRSFVNPVVVNRSFVTNRVIVTDQFFVNPFHRNVFFFNVGFGGFFPFFPVAYPYPAYYPYYPSYSPCGYYDPYGNWVNAPCPQYAPPVSAPQQGSSPQGVSDLPAPASEGAVGPQPPGY